MKVSVSIDLLRGRFTRLRQGRSFEALEKPVGVNRNTLQAFSSGRKVSQATLELIEAWCDAEEQRPV